MEQKKTLAAIFNFIGGVSGLISIAIILLKGGMLLQKVDGHETRLNNIEATGSIGLREHVKMDDERVTDVRNRTARLEDAMMKLVDLNADVKVLNAKVDSLKEQLSKAEVRAKP